MVSPDEEQMMMTTPTTTHIGATADDPRWARVLARDADADGAFWYSVATTGVYCRPSCPSRTANPGNVAIHDTLADARATGFRACRRCNPDGPSVEAAHAAIIADACRLIARSEAPPSLALLAAAASLSPTYFHRLFKRVTGLTPKGYADARRADRVRAALGEERSVTAAIYESGFASSGRFYARSNAMLGMTPSRYRDGGANEELRFAIGQSSLGAILVASSAKGVASVLIGDDPAALADDLQRRFPKARLVGGDRDYETLVACVVGLIEAPGLGLDLPLDIRGTAFQQRVWQALCAIPAGHTVSYTEIAARIGSPGSVRAVAGACAANPIAIKARRLIRSLRPHAPAPPAESRCPAFSPTSH